MGRSYLSIKLALAFGLCVGAIVLEFDRNRGRTAEPVLQTPAVTQERTSIVNADAPAEVVCMWRACPLARVAGLP